MSTAERPWYGWTILGVSSAALVASSPGQTFLVSLFNPLMRAELQLSASALSGAYLVATLGSSACMTWVGKGADRWGPGRFMLGAAVGLAGATLWMGLVGGFRALTVGFFLIRLFGQGALALASGHALAMWFDRRLGVAEGIRLSVFGLGMLLLPQLVNQSLVSLGWRLTWPLIGFSAASVVAVLVVLFHRDRPEAHGSTVDGVAVEVDASDEGLEGDTLGEAVGTPMFWAVVLCLANFAMAVTALMFHLQPLAVASGLPEDSAPALIGTFAVTSTSLYFLAGWLGDRLPAKPVLALAVLLLGLGELGFSSGAPRFGPYLAMVALGGTSALVSTTAAPTLARCFGRAHHGAIRGLASTVGVAGTAIGPFLLGLSDDWLGGFDPGLAVLLVASAASLALILGSRFR